MTRTNKVIEREKIKKILCIKPRGIGDIVLSTIILDSLHYYFKGVKIDYLVEEFAKPSLVDNPLINKVLTMEKKEFPLKAALKLRKEKYDLVIDLWSNPRSAQITFLSGIKYRTGFAYRGRRYAYNILAESGRGAHHSAEHNLELLKPLGVPAISKKVHYYINAGEKKKAKAFIKENISAGKRIFGIIPAGGWESKRCDASKWVEICKTILTKYDCTFLILWGPGDEQDANYIKAEMTDNAVLIGNTPLQEMAALIDECDFIIANDSGPMHISAALGKPTLGIFGPTNPVAHGPYSPVSDYINKADLHCIICNKLVCPYNHECMLELPVENVLEKINLLIEKD